MVVVASFNNEEKISVRSFTLLTYSSPPLIVTKIKSNTSISNLIKFDSKWDLNSTGGNWIDYSYLKNPQFLINCKNQFH